MSNKLNGNFSAIPIEVVQDFRSQNLVNWGQVAMAAEDQVHALKCVSVDSRDDPESVAIQDQYLTIYRGITLGAAAFAGDNHDWAKAVTPLADNEQKYGVQRAVNMSYAYALNGAMEAGRLITDITQGTLSLVGLKVIDINTRRSGKLLNQPARDLITRIGDVIVEHKEDVLASFIDTAERLVGTGFVVPSVPTISKVADDHCLLGATPTCDSSGKPNPAFTRNKAVLWGQLSDILHAAHDALAISGRPSGKRYWINIVPPSSGNEPR